MTTTDPLRQIRDGADEAAENALETDESAYNAYERVSGRAQALLDETGGVVAVSELDELVERWRDVDRDEYRTPAYKERMALADELETLINDEG